MRSSTLILLRSSDLKCVVVETSAENNIPLMHIFIALNLFKGNRITNITSKPYKLSGVHKNLTLFISPVLVVDRIP